MKNSESDGCLYRFGQFALDSRQRTLSRADSPVPLTAKAFDVLLFLAKNPNRLITKDELLKAVWGDTFVEEGNLTQYISHLRKALGDASEHARLIVTIARKGYQFTADVTVVEAVESRMEGPADEAVTIVPRRTQKVAVVGVVAVVLVIVSFASWRHAGSMTPPGPRRIMLAVLPFENLTGDPRYAAFLKKIHLTN
jgi:eukaryotic-like serine/threonine-protein kinase